MLSQLAKCSTKVIPTSCDVLVVGGGVIGLSTAYHLTKLGHKDVIVIERNEITSGTTWHSNGLVWRLRPSQTDVQLLSRTQHLLSKELVGHPRVESTGWINNGGLFVAHNTQRMQEYHRLHGLSKYYGIESFMLDRKQAIDLMKPLIDEKTSDVIGGLFSPGDGYVDPYMYCSALVRAADLQVFNNCRLISIKTKDCLEVEAKQRKVKSVFVQSGDDMVEIQTDHLVNCSGCWAPHVAKLAGINDLPQETMEHAFVITESIKGVEPTKTPNIRDHDLSVVFRVSGSSLCIGGYEPDPQVISDKVDSLQAYSLFDLNWDKFGINMENSIKLMPVLSKTGIKATSCGPESFTPDHKPLMGEDLNVRGFYHNSGFNSFGISLSGGAGYQMAEWISKGSPDCDMSSYDIKRFNKSLVSNRLWTRLRCRESYERNYGIVYQTDEPISGRDQTIKDDLYDTLLSDGCVYRERHGIQIPDWFDLEPKRLSAEEYIALDNTYDWSEERRQWKAVTHECRECKERAVIFNLSSMAKFSLKGQNSERVINSLSPKSLANNCTTLTYLLDGRGGIDSDIMINKVDSNHYYITCDNVMTNRVMSQINNLISDETITNTQLIDCSQPIAVLSVNGPNSTQMIENCLNISVQDLKERTHKEINVEGIQIRVIRISLVSDIGWELHFNTKDLKTIYSRLIGHPLLSNAGLRAYESLKNENRYLSAAVDLRTEDRPSDLGLDYCAEPNKSSNRSIDGSDDKYFVRIRLEAKNPIVWGLEPIYHNSRVIGLVRKCFYSHSSQQMMAFGHIYRSSCEGSDLPRDVEIQIFGKQYKATIDKLEARL